MKILVLAEQDQAQNELSLGARRVGDRVETIVIGKTPKAIKGADKIWLIPEQQEAMIEDYKDSMTALIQREKYDMILVEPTKRYKLIAGQLAAILGASVIPNVMEILNGNEAKHMVYGGTAIRQEKASGPVTIAMVGPGVLAIGDDISENNEVEIFDFVEPRRTIRLIGREMKEKAIVNLPGAKKVIGVGRGLASEEDLKMIRELAAAIGGEVGCTRPIAETEHWMPRELYIGVSGLMIAPEIYIAIGVSGQVQHTVGIDRAKTVIAINNDKKAAIFKQADYGIVGDLYKVVPALNAALK